MGAQCVNRARWDLCGGRRATGGPTATNLKGVFPYVAVAGGAHLTWVRRTPFLANCDPIRGTTHFTFLQ